MENLLNSVKIKKLENDDMSKVMWKPGTFIYPIPAVVEQ